MVSVQRQLILFHERKEGMQLLMDRSLAVLAHLRKEEIQVCTLLVLSHFLLAYFYASNSISYSSLTYPPRNILSKVSEIEVQASRASSLMTDLKRIVPDVEMAMGPLLKVGGGGGVVRTSQ